MKRVLFISDLTQHYTGLFNVIGKHFDSVLVKSKAGAGAVSLESIWAMRNKKNAVEVGKAELDQALLYPKGFRIMGFSFREFKRIVGLRLRWGKLNQWINAFINYFGDNGIDCLVLWNGRVPAYRAAAVVAARVMGIPVVFFERGVLPNKIYADPKGINADSSIALSSHDLFNEKKAMGFIKDYKSQTQSVESQPKRRSKQELCQSLGIPNGKKIIFVPLQIQEDTQIYIFSHWIKSMKQLVTEVSKALGDNVEYCLIVKKHPLDSRNYNFNHLKNVFFVQDVNVKDLIEFSDALITVNSGVGLEALLYYKPVVCLGKAVYSNYGITIPARSREELRKALANLKEPNKKKIHQFVYRLLDYYLDFPLHREGLQKVISLIDGLEKH